MIEVIENDDGSFTISWDENDPKENILSNYTAEELTQIICDYAKQTLEESRDADFIIDQTAEEVEQDIDTLNRFLETTEEDWKDFWGSDYYQKQ